MQPGDVMDGGDTSEAEVREKIVKAIAIGKAMGKEVGGAVRKLVDEMLNPKADYKEELADWCRNASRDDYSFSRPARRFISRGLKVPGMHSPTGSMNALAVVLDSSGSVTDGEAMRYLTEVAAAANDCAPTELYVAICTTRVEAEFHLTPPFEDFEQVREAFTSGGTDMEEGIRWAENLPVDVDGVVVFTDGCTSFTQEPEIPVLWCMTTNKKAPYGRTLYVGD